MYFPRNAAYEALTALRKVNLLRIYRPTIVDLATLTNYRLTQHITLLAAVPPYVYECPCSYNKRIKEKTGKPLSACSFVIDEMQLYARKSAENSLAAGVPPLIPCMNPWIDSSNDVPSSVPMHIWLGRTPSQTYIAPIDRNVDPSKLKLYTLIRRYYFKTVHLNVSRVIIFTTL
jgi:hypothetical protein